MYFTAVDLVLENSNQVLDGFRSQLDNQRVGFFRQSGHLSCGNGCRRRPAHRFWWPLEMIARVRCSSPCFAIVSLFSTGIIDVEVDVLLLCIGRIDHRSDIVVAEVGQGFYDRRILQFSFCTSRRQISDLDFTSFMKVIDVSGVWPADVRLIGFLFVTIATANE